METPDFVRPPPPTARCITSFGGFHVTNVSLVVQFIGLFGSLFSTILYSVLKGKVVGYETLSGGVTVLCFLIGIVGNRTTRWPFCIPLVVLSFVYAAASSAFLVYTYVNALRQLDFFSKTVLKVVKPNFSAELTIKAIEFLRDTCIAHIVFMVFVVSVLLFHLFVRDLNYLRLQCPTKKVEDREE